MKHININKLGIAIGATGVALYVGCMLIMAIFGTDGTIQFFDYLLHGLDTSSIIRMNIPLSESLIGIVLTFLIGWLSGACIACTYNFTMRNSD